MSDIEKLYAILREKGGEVADIAGRVLLEGGESPLLKEPLGYLAEHRHDVLRPALMSWGCESVGGDCEEVVDAAVAMVLKCYELGVLDDMVDAEGVVRFHYTLSGRFGGGVALLLSVILNAKACHSLGLLAGKLDCSRFRMVNLAFRDFLVKMMEGEALNLAVKRRGIVDEGELMTVFRLQSADIEACMRIGACIGGGSDREVEALAAYGTLLGTMFLIRDDVSDALNLTVKLSGLIKKESYPYPLLWALNRSERMRRLIVGLRGRVMTPNDVGRLVTLLLEEGALEHAKRLVSRLADEAIQRLSGLEKNRVVETLEFAAAVQPRMVHPRA